MQRYDIFKTLRDGSPYWIGVADDLAQATQTIEGLAARTEGVEYFVRDSRLGCPVAHAGNRQGRESFPGGQ